MKWHEEAVDKAGIEAAIRLAGICKDFYLAGGTALSLQMGHRISLDFDLFSQTNHLGMLECQKLIESLRSSGKLKIIEIRDGTCHLTLGGTSVSLFHYPYPLLNNKLSKWRGLAVAGLEDIASMKLSAVLGRGARKDFIDLYFLARELGFDHVLNIGFRKFPDHEDFVLQSLRALAYFNDAEDEPMPRMLTKTCWEEIKRFFEAEVKKTLRAELVKRK